MPLMPSRRCGNCCEQIPRLRYPAEQEMYHAARYYELQACGLGQDFLDKVVLAIQEPLQAPERWPFVQDDIHRRLIGRFRIRFFIAYSGPNRPAFRRESGHRSDGKAATVPR